MRVQTTNDGVYWYGQVLMNEDTKKEHWKTVVGPCDEEIDVIRELNMYKKRINPEPFDI